MAGRLGIPAGGWTLNCMQHGRSSGWFMDLLCKYAIFPQVDKLFPTGPCLMMLTQPVSAMGKMDKR